MRRRGTMHATLEVQISLHYAIEYSTVLKERKGVGLMTCSSRCLHKEERKEGLGRSSDHVANNVTDISSIMQAQPR